MATITITHTHADGTLVEGSRKGDGVYEIIKPFGFSFFPSIRALGIRQSRDRVAKRYAINGAAEALRAAGHEVTVEIDDAHRDRAQVLADQADRLEDRRDALENKATRHAGAAEAAYRHSHALVEHIPMGQPVLPGKRGQAHRNTLDRSINAAIRSAQEQATADAIADRAARVGREAARRNSPTVTAGRIATAEAELRKIARDLEGYERNHLNGRGEIIYTEKHGPATGEHRVSLLARQAQLHDQVAYDRAQLEQAKEQGRYVEHGPETIHVGDVIGGSRVVKVNKKTVSLETGYSWTDKLPYTQISKVKCPHVEAEHTD